MEIDLEPEQEEVLVVVGGMSMVLLPALLAMGVYEDLYYKCCYLPINTLSKFAQCLLLS
jgi:hypothetical protein